MKYATLLLAFLLLCAPVTVQDTYKPLKSKKTIKLKLPKKEKKPLQEKKLNMYPYPGFVLDSTFGDWIDTTEIEYKLWE